jgi:hypothetical protein
MDTLPLELICMFMEQAAPHTYLTMTCVSHTWSTLLPRRTNNMLLTLAVQLYFNMDLWELCDSKGLITEDNVHSFVFNLGDYKLSAWLYKKYIT